MILIKGERMKHMVFIVLSAVILAPTLVSAQHLGWEQEKAQLAADIQVIGAQAPHADSLMVMLNHKLTALDDLHALALAAPKPKTKQRLMGLFEQHKERLEQQLAVIKARTQTLGSPHDEPSSLMKTLG